MIRATTSRPGNPKGPLVLLGLSAGNVRRLTGGEPILVDLATLLPQQAAGKPVRAELVIHYGETLGAIADELAAHGLPLPSEERQRIDELDADETAR